MKLELVTVRWIRLGELWRLEAFYIDATGVQRCHCTGWQP